MKKILVTGSAGFIGFHLTKTLLKNGFEVTGIDNLNNYYDPSLKAHRLDEIDNFINKSNLGDKYRFIKMDISDFNQLNCLFQGSGFDVVYNLAAQAGVRYSIENPMAYIQSNLVGFGNVLECCRTYNTGHLVFASSSSVYGMNRKQPFSVGDLTDYPVSLYAASKKSNELMAHSYSHLYKIPCTGLRFFTVYGPYGRPDMAYFKFAEAINKGQSIDVYNNGFMKRDFTYIDDIVEGLLKVQSIVPDDKDNKISGAKAPFKIFNLGNNKPVNLIDFIEIIGSALNKDVKKNMLPMQAGDVLETYADIDDLFLEIGFKPKTSIESGIRDFISWYQEYMNKTLIK
ncbi:NAD-dependent epimerase/dehydratase family protein [Gammaproteobacteria bacterium]|nr:NAD-dependent epimerase/dehydratase family protein [Gammaproteobacteria bacterium]